MNIRKLVLEEVASFGHAEIEFQPGRDPNKADIHILVGPNGTGKSTILMALAQAFSREETGLQKRFHGHESGVFIDFDTEPSCGIVMDRRKDNSEVDRGHALLKTIERTNGVAFMIDQRSPSWKELHELRTLIAQYEPTNSRFDDSRFSTVAFAYSGQRSVASFQLTAIQELRISPLNQALNFTSGGSPDQLVQWIANSKAKEAFALAKGDQDKADKRRKAIERIEETVSSITGRRFQFVMQDDPLKVTAAINDHELELDVLPDGLKSIISWIADLLMRMDRIPWVDDIPVLERQFLLFLDEIEVHLHPAWQRKVLPTVQGLFPNAQVFISTHSPFIIASADDAWIYPLYEGQNGGGTIVGKPLPSMVGNSYATVLRDALGVDADFAPQIEERLNAFYELRDAVLAGAAEVEDLATKASELRSLGEEVAAIVIPELRQVERRLASPHEGGAA